MGSNHDIAFYLAISKNILSNKSNDEQIWLINVLQEHDFNERVFDILTDKNILRGRTCKEQISLINELEKYKYNENSYGISVDKDALLHLLTDGQIMLVDDSYNVEANNQELKDEFTFGEIFEQLTIEEIEKIVDSMAENDVKEVTMKTKVKRLYNKINN